MRNSNTNHTNVTLNSTSRGCKAEPYPFSASAVIQSLFKINELGNGETCQGLRHWKLLFSLKNNFSRPVRNDMDNKNRLDCFAFARNDMKRHPEGTRAEDVRCEPYPFNASVKNPKDLSTNYKHEPSPEFVSSSQLTNKFYPQLSALDSLVSPQLNGSLCITKREGKENRKELINLSTYRLIDFKEILRLKPQNDEANKNITNLVPKCPSVLKPLKKKLAFTLAETLITIGIIGIVAAMTIPTLITNYQKKQTVTKLQKAISVLNQAYKLSFDDVGEPSAQEAYDMGSEQYFKTYWAPYIKTALICTTYQQCGYKELQPWKTASNKKNSTGVVNSTHRATFYTSDGFLYVIFTGIGKTAEEGFIKNNSIIVDLNGHEGPNRVGRDVFYLTRVEKDGAGIQTFGMAYSDEDVNKNCSNEGYTCAEKIRRAGWEIDKSYPWK